MAQAAFLPTLDHRGPHTDRASAYELVIFSVLAACGTRNDTGAPFLAPRVPTRLSFVRRMNASWSKVGCVAACSVLVGLGCAHNDGPSLSKDTRDTRSLRAGEAAPSRSEVDAAGAIRAPIRRGQRTFGRLVRSEHASIVFKDEEGTGADRMMSRRLRTRLHRLADRVEKEWPGITLRVTEAWDEQDEHGKHSLHYEGRAADLTTSDRDAGKLGRLAGLAVEAGMDWVYFENASHVHVSVKRTER